MEILGAFRGFCGGFGIPALGISTIFWGATEGSGLGFGAGRKNLQVFCFGFPSSLNSILNQIFQDLRKSNFLVLILTYFDFFVYRFVLTNYLV